jgi:LysR substrate binding domain
MLTVVVAAPDYLSRHGTAKTPEDIRRHHFVLHAGQLQTAKLTLTGPKGRTVTIPCRSRFTVSSILGVRDAVTSGAGLNAEPLWLYADAIDRGELVRVLPAWNPPRYPVHALMLPSRYRPAKTNSALGMLARKGSKVAGNSWLKARDVKRNARDRKLAYTRLPCASRPNHQRRGISYHRSIDLVRSPTAVLTGGQPSNSMDLQ